MTNAHTLGDCSPSTPSTDCQVPSRMPAQPCPEHIICRHARSSAHVQIQLENTSWRLDLLHSGLSRIAGGRALGVCPGMILYPMLATTRSRMAFRRAFGLFHSALASCLPSSLKDKRMHHTSEATTVKFAASSSSRHGLENAEIRKPKLGVSQIFLLWAWSGGTIWCSRHRAKLTPLGRQQVRDLMSVGPPPDMEESVWPKIAVPSAQPLIADAHLSCSEMHAEPFARTPRVRDHTDEARANAP